MTRYLSLGTYPRRPVTQGGRLRLDAIHRQLQATRGWQSWHLWTGTPADDAGTFDDEVLIPQSRAFRRDMGKNGRREDVSSSRFILGDAHAWQQFTAAIREIEPDIIAVEQAMLWPALRHHLKQTNLRSSIKLVYSAHNVEQQLISDEIYRMDGQGIQTDCKEIISIESSLAAEADLIIAVSEADAAFFRSFNSNVTVKPNGIWPRETRPGHDGGLFVGSAHAPNAQGFIELIGPWLEQAYPARPLTVVGGVCDLLRMPFASAVHANKLRLLGVVDGAALEAALDAASFLILPITTGGGTNIKTAEALATRKPLLATRMAMRGYEAFLGLPTVHIADEAGLFGTKLDALSRTTAAPILTAEWVRLLETLSWPHALAGLVEALAQPSRSGWRPATPGPDRIPRRLWITRADGWEIDGSGVAHQTMADASLHIRFADPLRSNGTLKLALSGQCDINHPQRIGIQFNDAPVAELVFDQFQAVKEYLLSLPADCDEVRLVFKCDRLISGADLGQSSECQPLGVQVKGLWLWEN